MKQELIFIVIAAFLGMNIYYDGKYTKLIMGWKKHFKIGAICIFLLCIYLFMKKHPNDYRSLLGHLNGMIKFLPIDKHSADMITPLLSATTGQAVNYTTPQFKRMMNSGYQTSSHDTLGMQQVKHSNRMHNRSVSPVKKKYIASMQGWSCAQCKTQLDAWFEVDHKTRLDQGGSNHVTNLEALCRNCHGKKTGMESL